MIRAARRGWRYRGNVAARAATATLGAYAIGAFFAMASARLLPMPRVDAVVTGTMPALAMLPVVAIWAFLARSPLRAVAGVAVVAALLALAAWLAGPP